MAPDNKLVANFIIGGADKAGTTSVFMYLSEHPQVCGASSKETNFFRHHFTGDVARDTLQYAKHFKGCTAATPVIMEASPAYLSQADTVVPRMISLVPDIKFLFILRDPVERLYSAYNFYRSKLEIDENINFMEYVELCLAYDRGEAKAGELKLDEWYLNMLRFGCYAKYLEKFYSTFPNSHIKIMLFDHLTSDVSGFMKELSMFLGIDREFWDTYEYRKTNVTFSSSNKFLHKAAISLNNRMEPFLRQRPGLKHSLVRLYKMINQAREGYDSMPAPVEETLKRYYGPHNKALCRLLGREDFSNWSC